MLLLLLLLLLPGELCTARAGGAVTPSREPLAGGECALPGSGRAASRAAAQDGASAADIEVATAWFRARRYENEPTDHGGAATTQQRLQLAD